MLLVLSVTLSALRVVRAMHKRDPAVVTPHALEAELEALEAIDIEGTTTSAPMSRIAPDVAGGGGPAAGPNADEAAERPQGWQHDAPTDEPGSQEGAAAKSAKKKALADKMIAVLDKYGGAEKLEAIKRAIDKHATMRLLIDPLS